MADTVTVSGDNLVVKDKDGNQVYPAGAPVPPNPTAKPVVRITTAGGNATTGTPVNIEGTIDLPNVGCDVLVDAGPTSFGTTKADAQGKWTKSCALTTTGLWTITAHATNAAGKADSNSVSFQVSAEGGGGGGGGGADAPPEPVTEVNADKTAIQNAINACPAGGSVKVRAGTVNLGGQSIRLKAGICVWADGVVNMNGGPGAGSNGAFDGGNLQNWVITGKAPGQGFVFNGSMVNATGAQQWLVANCTFNDQPSNNYDGSVIRFGGSRYGVACNNDINRAQGNNFGMYNFSDFISDGNHFDRCRQPHSMQFPTTADTNLGKNIALYRNTGTKTTRAFIEVGPASTGAEYTKGLKAINNWQADFEVSGSDPGVMLPISYVAQAAEDTEVRDNYNQRGPGSQWAACCAIETTGTGETKNNVSVGFAWHGFMYQHGWNIHDNQWYTGPGDISYAIDPGGWDAYKGATGTKTNNVKLTSAPPVPPRPERIATSTYYPWNGNSIKDTIEKNLTTPGGATRMAEPATRSTPPLDQATIRKNHREWLEHRRKYKLPIDAFDGDSGRPPPEATRLAMPANFLEGEPEVWRRMRERR